jgi:hypothetical protein
MALLKQQGITQQTLADTPTAQHPTDTGLSTQQLSSIMQQLQQNKQQTARASQHSHDIVNNSSPAHPSPLAWAVACSPEIARFTTLEQMFKQHVMSNSNSNTLGAVLTEDETIADALVELLPFARAPLLATAKAQQLLLLPSAADANKCAAAAAAAQDAADSTCQPSKAREQQQAQGAAVGVASREVRTQLLLQAVPPAQRVVVLGELLQALLNPQDCKDRCARTDAAAAICTLARVQMLQRVCLH